MNSSDVIVRYGWRYFPFLSINNCSDSPRFLLSINSLQMQVRIASFELKKHRIVFERNLIKLAMEVSDLNKFLYLFSSRF